MKSRFFILIVFLAIFARPGGPQQANVPVGKDQVMVLVKAGMGTPQLVKLIHEHGIDFDLTEDYLQALRQAGAQEAVIQALRAARPKPLTEDQVMELVAGGVPPERAATLVKEHGMDFVADDRYLQTLRLAGGDDALIAAVREASKAVAGELVVVTSRDAEVFLDGELLGKAGTEGELAVKAKPGAHALKVSLKGKKDFEQSVTLAARQTTNIEARLEALAPIPGQVRVNPKDGLKYVWIPPGTFMMGCSPGDNECSPGETPHHQVTITKGFWIGQTPVTVGAFKRFTTAAGQAMPPEPAESGLALNPGWKNDAMPIVDVTWDEAQAYCSWAGGRLLTEAEWEYAARGGSTEVRYGSLDDVAWYADNSGVQRLDSTQIWNSDQNNYGPRLKDNGDRMHEVGLKRPNSFGLFDVLGNADEWVADWYDGNYYQNSPSQDPPGPASGQSRVARGGSWRGTPRYVRLSLRDSASPTIRWSTYGFRCGGELGGP